HAVLWAPFRTTLTAAGWSVVPESVDANPASAVVRYSRPGTDAWAFRQLFGADDVRVELVEAAAPGAAFGPAPAAASPAQIAARQRDCHLALYGVKFDFNQATLRPGSEPVLARVAALLQGNAALTVEVQGHTDNVGGDASNLKLSQGRADAVKAWLVAHGIAA